MSIAALSVSIKSRDLEGSFFQQLQEAVLTPAAVDYLVQRLTQAQRQKKASTEFDKRPAGAKGRNRPHCLRHRLRSTF